MLLHKLQEKERKKKEEEEQKKREEEEQLRLEREEAEKKEQIKRMKVELASEIPEEPPAGEADVVRVLVKLPGGQVRIPACLDDYDNCFFSKS